ncbi:unnamed protein product [Brachionus calyciflorus]|uniref:Ig-like domain-containing protein n=1 Tax=Brachionus calyciflorus TaxID=104777 RepID=A0A813X126_9BILA|nr:unnamed protein product [Brachionus calyciflorus]
MTILIFNMIPKWKKTRLNVLILITIATVLLNKKVSSQETPRILTKEVFITSYEHHTVILPCEIESLPSELPVIWQYGRRGERNQTVLTVGGTQLENNYRIRVLTNSSDQQFSENSKKITIHNLEIRKLHNSDSGWYECQLPTKPTQINYIKLEVLTLPRIEVSSKNARLGEKFELVCQVKNLPKRFELNWFFNDKKLTVYQDRKYPLDKKRHASFESIFENDSFIHIKKKSTENSEFFSIVNEKFQNLTLSRLKIRDLTERHKGVYKCKYDRIESKYYLDIKNNNKKERILSYDQLTSSKQALKLNSVLFLFSSLFFKFLQI